MTDLALTLIAGDRSRQIALQPSDLVIAGWTGRDGESMEKHIQELEELGVKRPPFTPCFYRVSATRLTTSSSIQVIGGASSGEVEFVVLNFEGRLWIGVGSDHTDREVEAYDVTVSKQMCDKPIAAEFIAFDDLAPGWDDVMLRSEIIEEGRSRVYQEGSVVKMRDPRELLAMYQHEGKGLPDRALMFCGTFAAQGGVRPAARFDFSLTAAHLGRTISHGYDVVSIPPFAETRRA